MTNLKITSMEFLEHSQPILKLFWYIAIPTSIIFLIQTILTVIGADHDSGFDTEFHTDVDIHSDFDASQLFSLRNLINFLLGFSWSGISFFEVIKNPMLLIGVSVLIGLVFVFMFFIIIKQIQKLAEDNSFHISNTLNKTAEVYLTIPGNKSGKGKIMISVNGTFHELEAMTESERITSGSTVKVVKIDNNNTIIVQTI